MTLHVTIATERYLVQASDRRLISFPAHRVDDEANKAVLLQTAKGVLAFTYTGIATPFVGLPMTTDRWLADLLCDRGAAELDGPFAVETLRSEATRVFGSLPARYGPTAFIVGGFEKAERGDGLRLWSVDNYCDPTRGPRAPEFRTRTMHRFRRILITGAHAAVTRPIRRRLQAGIAAAATTEQVERAAVAAIRSAAESSRGATIGRSCATVVVAPDGRCRAQYHGVSRSQRQYSPRFVWYARGVNFVVGRLGVSPLENCRLEIGDDHRPIYFETAESAGRKAITADPTRIGAEFRRVFAVHRIADLRGESSVVRGYRGD